MVYLIPGLFPPTDMYKSCIKDWFQKWESKVIIIHLVLNISLTFFPWWCGRNCNKVGWGRPLEQSHRGTLLLRLRALDVWRTWRAPSFLIKCLLIWLLKRLEALVPRQPCKPCVKRRLFCSQWNCVGVCVCVCVWSWGGIASASLLGLYIIYNQSYLCNPKSFWVEPWEWSLLLSDSCIVVRQTIKCWEPPAWIAMVQLLCLAFSAANSMANVLCISKSSLSPVFSHFCDFLVS